MDRGLEGFDEGLEWFVRGSYVLDRLFGTSAARDIDVFRMPGIATPFDSDDRADMKEYKLSPREVIPEGKYNLDLYLITEDGIIHPEGFPDVPVDIDVTLHYERQDFSGIGPLSELVRGMRNSIRYGLRPTKRAEDVWRRQLETLLSDGNQDRFYGQMGLTIAYLKDIQEQTGADMSDAIGYYSSLHGKEGVISFLGLMIGMYSDRRNADEVARLCSSYSRAEIRPVYLEQK